MLNQLIIETDPEEAKKLGLVKNYGTYDDDMGVGTIKHQEDDQGLEAQVHALVANLWKQYEE